MDGCSLTIGEVWGNCFCVYLIPETIRVTVFGIKGPGAKVNLEIDTQTQVGHARARAPCGMSFNVYSHPGGAWLGDEKAHVPLPVM